MVGAYVRMAAEAVKSVQNGMKSTGTALDEISPYLDCKAFLLLSMTMEAQKEETDSRNWLSDVNILHSLALQSGWDTIMKNQLDCFG